MSVITDGFLKRAKLTIPAAQVGSGGVSNYTVTIDGAVIGSGHAFWAGVQSDGGDIRFSSDQLGETRLAVDIIALDTGAKTCEINLGQVALSSASVNEFWLWWDHASNQSQPAVGAAFGQYAVYETASTARWPMNLVGGAVSDRTSNVKHGTRLGSGGANNLPQEVAGKLGKALNFDSTDDAVSFPPVDLSGAFTFTLWFKSSAATGAMMAYDVVAGIDKGLYIYGSGGRVDIYGPAQSGFYVPLNQNVDNADGLWHNLVVTRNGTTNLMYMDGVQVVSSAGDGGNPTPTAAFLLNSYDFTGYGIGDRDDIRFYNRALSAADVVTNFRNTNSPSTFASLGAEEATATSNRRRRAIICGAA